MKWIAVHQNEVVGEFKNEADAERYKEAADRAAFEVVLIEVDDADYGCYIKMTGLYGMPDHDAYYRKNGDCFDFCNDRDHATFFPGGRDNEDVKRILDSAEWYTKQYDADKLVAQPFYQFTQKNPTRDLLDSVPMLLEIIQNTLNPSEGEFFGKSEVVRWNAFRQFWYRNRDKVLKKHCRVYQIIEQILDKRSYQLLTDEALRQVNDEIQEKCSYFKEEPPYGIEEDTNAEGCTHEGGIGWNPNGVWCGECTKESGKGCPNLDKTEEG